jgi:hypothetical protein
MSISLPHPLSRHGRACPGHPDASATPEVRSGAAAIVSAPPSLWVAGTSPAMTVLNFTKRPD